VVPFDETRSRRAANRTTAFAASPAGVGRSQRRRRNGQAGRRDPRRGPTKPGLGLVAGSDPNAADQALELCGALGDPLLIPDQQPQRRLQVRRTVPADSSSRNWARTQVIAGARLARRSRLALRPDRASTSNRWSWSVDSDGQTVCPGLISRRFADDAGWSRSWPSHPSPMPRGAWRRSSAGRARSLGRWLGGLRGRRRAGFVAAPAATATAGAAMIVCACSAARESSSVLIWAGS
jgi:hypothetical protein